MNKKLGIVLIILVGLLGCSRSNVTNGHENNSVRVDDEVNSSFSFEDYLSLEYGNWNIQYREIGNFTGNGIKDGRVEEVIFFEDPKRRYNQGDEDRISDVYFFIYNDEKLIYESEIPIRSSAYRPDHIETILQSTSSFNVPDRPYFFLDLNNNGLDEIFFFSLTGINFGLVIIEYHDTNFKLLLGSTEYTKILKKAELIDNSIPVIRLIGAGNSSTGSGEKDWYEVAWDEEHRKYILLEKGTE